MLSLITASNRFLILNFVSLPRGAHLSACQKHIATKKASNRNSKTSHFHFSSDPIRSTKT